MDTLPGSEIGMERTAVRREPQKVTSLVRIADSKPENFSEGFLADPPILHEVAANRRQNPVTTS
jgi:hypothetical protein